MKAQLLKLLMPWIEKLIEEKIRERSLSYEKDVIERLWKIQNGLKEYADKEVNAAASRATGKGLAGIEKEIDELKRKVEQMRRDQPLWN